MKIMCFVSPWCIDQYTTIAQGVDPDAEILLISGFENIDESKLNEKYYTLIEKNRNKKFENNNENNDIIKRCRLLRSLKIDEALLHLESMRESVSFVFDNFQPDLVISKTIDQFLIDLLDRECKKRNLPFVGLVISFIDGYYRISARGEYSKFREPLNNEIKDVLKNIAGKSYKPSYVLKSVNNHKRDTINRWFRNNLRSPYFFLKRIFSREKYNYHYWINQLNSVTSFHFFPRLKLGDPNWENKIVNSGKPIIYIPLQVFPEATIDYWCENLDVINYEEKLLEIIGILSTEFTLLIKEHPNVVGLRHPKLYDKLTTNQHVTICPVNVDSNYLVGLSDSVLVWTGSVGFEAALRGKPVLAMTHAYYMHGSRFKVIDNNTPINEIKLFILENTKELTTEDKEQMIYSVLKGLIPGKFVNNFWSINNEADFQDSINIGKSIKRYILENR